MKKILICLILLPVLTGNGSCSKAIEDKKMNVLMDIITNGSWVITSYKEGNTEITSAFTGFEFFFLENEKVRAVKDLEEFLGTWKGNVADYSIISDFSGAAFPLDKLNGKWIIKDSDYYYVKAVATINSTSNTVEMKKRR